MEVVIDGVRYVPEGFVGESDPELPISKIVKREPEVILSTLKIKVEVDMDESTYKDIATIVADEINKQKLPGGLLNR